MATACAWPQTAKQTDQMDALLTCFIEWDRLLALCDRHRVNGLVYAALAWRQDIPAGARNTLAQRATRITQNNLLSTAMAARIIQTLETVAVPSVVLKGTTLGQLAFGNSGMRHTKDIDLLLDAADMARAEQILAQLGFIRSGDSPSLNTTHAQRWTRFRKHFEYVHSATGTRLEVHWKPFDNRRLLPIALDQRQWVAVGDGLRLPTLPLPELLVYLCVHGASHAWFRLKWLADIAALLQHPDAPSADRLLAVSRARGLERPVEQALLLCRALWDLPNSSSSAIQPSRTVRWLTSAARDALLTETTESPSAETDFVPLRQGRSRVLLRREWRYRLEEAKVFAAAPADWEALPLPPAMAWAYPLLRVPLWLKRKSFPPVVPKAGRSTPPNKSGAAA